MTHNELKRSLETIGIPVCYHHFKRATKPPYIAFIRTGQKTIGADNKAYAKNNIYNIELYTSKKDVELEERLEQLFSDCELYYEFADEIYIDSEDMYEIIYEIEI